MEDILAQTLGHLMVMSSNGLYQFMREYAEQQEEQGNEPSPSLWMQLIMAMDMEAGNVIMN